MWGHAVSLFLALSNGGEPPKGRSWDVPLYEGEWIVADTSAEYARFYGTDVQYQQTSGFYFGSLTFVAVAAGVDAMSNASRRHAAQQQAAIQWRDHQMLRMIVSTVHLLCDTMDMGWAGFGYQAMTNIQPDLPSRQVFFEFDGPAQPMRIAGPGAALASVMAIHGRYGMDGLRQHPGLEPIRRSAHELLQWEAQQRAQLAPPQQPAQAPQQSTGAHAIEQAPAEAETEAGSNGEQPPQTR